MGSETYRIKKAERKAAKYRDYQDGFGMLHLLNLDTDIVENLSVNPTSHHNGTWQEPPKTAMMAWFALVSRDKQINQQVVQQLPAQAESQLDLLTIFTQPTQSYAIIAGQQVGKTFQACLVVNITYLKLVGVCRSSRGWQRIDTRIRI